jgi:predicted anti-sigma-YlaC factor YlaD
MTDKHLAHDLLRFHLGASEDTEHAAVESHLLACRECLEAYLGLKRRFDFAAATDERPSPAVRERLRATVRRRAVPYRGVRAFAFGAAFAAAALLVLLWVQRAQHSGEERADTPETLIDTGDSRVAQAL